MTPKKKDPGWPKKYPVHWVMACGRCGEYSALKMNEATFKKRCGYGEGGKPYEIQQPDKATPMVGRCYGGCHRDPKQPDHPQRKLRHYGWAESTESDYPVSIHTVGAFDAQARRDFEASMTPKRLGSTAALNYAKEQTGAVRSTTGVRTARGHLKAGLKFPHNYKIPDWAGLECNYDDPGLDANGMEPKQHSFHFRWADDSKHAQLIASVHTEMRRNSEWWERYGPGSEHHRYHYPEDYTRQTKFGEDWPLEEEE